ncbi:unnamed protein product [Pylaiella littoralis]
MMTPVLVSSHGRSKKRKRQVSWAEAELLEEVKFFHVTKPVNPSIPPPVVDDAGEEDAVSQPGLALLGLLGVESSSPHSASTSSSSASPSPPTLLSSSTTTPAALVGGAATPNGGGNFGAAATSAQQPSDEQAGAGTGAGSRRSLSSSGDGARAEGEGTGRQAGGSRLFKGFEKTETVVRRKKQVAPPPPPPGTPPPLPPPGEGAHLTHRYPKDIWPGHKPPNHTLGVKEANGGGGAGVAAEEQLEFFCDGCDETIPNGIERMECAVCPDEFCLCHGCYDEGEVLDKRHKHELLPSAASFHVTRAASSAEAALEAAKVLHVTEAQHGEGLPYDDDDLG